MIEKIKCPYCGHEQAVQADKNAVCRGLWMRCKARHCGKVFEIHIPPKRGESHDAVRL